MRKQSDPRLLAAVFRRSIPARDANAPPPEPLVQRWVHRWFGIALARILVIAATMGLLLTLYVGSYFATAFATGAGWMEVATRSRIVWTLHWPISKRAVGEPFSGPRYINDANGWFYTLGWQWLHE